MPLSTRRRALVSLTVAFFASAALPALAAPDATATAEAVAAWVTVFGGEGSSFTYANASATATDVVLTDVKVTIGSEETSAQIPELVVVNPVPRPEGGFTADSISFNNTRALNGGDNAETVVIAEGSAQGIVFPGAAELEANPRFVPVASLDLRSLSGDSESTGMPISIGSMHIEVANAEDGQPNDLKLAIEGFAIPIEAFEFDEQMTSILGQMGYGDQFLVGVTFDGTYAEEADTLTLRSIALRAEDVGELDISGIIGDFPIGNLLEGADLAQNALTAATLHSASIKFTNLGVIDRLFELQARSFNTTKEQFAMTTSMALPFMISQMIGNGALTTALTEPLAAFVADPRSLTITSTPATPIPVLAIAGAAQGGVQALPDLLALDVKANQ